MEGPTPVSALIHAATMVTAGVYLVVRMHPLFMLSPIRCILWALSVERPRFFASLCAVGQTDLKRVLAYSTISQLASLPRLRCRRFLCGHVPFNHACFYESSLVPCCRRCGPHDARPHRNGQNGRTRPKNSRSRMCSFSSVSWPCRASLPSPLFSART